MALLKLFRANSSLGPRPKPTPARIASSITRVILDAIHASAGGWFGSGTETRQIPIATSESLQQYVPIADVFAYQTRNSCLRWCTYLCNSESTSNTDNATATERGGESAGV